MRLTVAPGRVAWVAAAVAVVVFLPALGNGWALDDVGVIERNARAHDLGAALRGFFEPYWPRAGDRTAGLYRPLVIVTYAVDWTLAGGRPWLAHLTNAVWHGLATGLFVLVAAAWLTGPALLVAGLVFALHPVHVEAVANVVGRAELLAAVCVFATLLLARRGRTGWAVLTAAAGLLVKEHAIVVVPLLLLDHVLTRAPRRSGLGLYFALGALVLAWLHLWRAIAGGFVLETVAAPFRDVGTGERVMMMLPVFNDVVRLLVWPFTLAADYNPWLVAPITTMTAAGVLGAATAGALLLLAWRSRHRAPAIAFGMIGGALAWGPTANLVVPSGIVLSERTLYLPSIAVALAAGVLVPVVMQLAADRRRLVLVGVGLLGMAWVARIQTRIPFWHDTRTVVVEDYLQHPENYRAHARVGSVFEITGDTASALREFLLAAEIWPGDYVLTLQTTRAARAVGRPAVALREARRGYAMAPDDPVIADQLAAVLAWVGRRDEALDVVRDALRATPDVLLLHRRQRELLGGVPGAGWWPTLVEARIAWLTGRPAEAGVLLARAGAALSAEPPAAACDDLRDSAVLARNLHSEAAGPLTEAARAACSGD